MSYPSAERQNRFSRHPILSGLVVALLALVMTEVMSALLLWFLHRPSGSSHYEPNRIISGYTVYRQTPGFDFATSTIRKEPNDPPVILDDQGFICDEPITVEKPTGVIRIFLMGGSAAIGAGQTDSYAAPKKYPWGIYAYHHSIAGQIRTVLQPQVAGGRVQVITAAAFGRKLHQSLVEYLQTVSRFSPDVVITFDGMNDRQTFLTGTAWQDSEAELPYYIDLWCDQYRQPLWRRTNTANVLSHVMRRLGVFDPRAKTVARSDTAEAASRSEYASHRDQFIRAAESFLQDLNHFKSVVNADGAAFIFALQPMLHRTGANKKLSPVEEQFAALQMPGLTPEEGHLRDLVSRYFFDDYLSRECARRVQGFQAVAVDCNREMEGVGSDVEVYTDYCHLTFEGNRITAESLSRACMAFIRPPGAQPSL